MSESTMRARAAAVCVNEARAQDGAAVTLDRDGYATNAAGCRLVAGALTRMASAIHALPADDGGLDRSPRPCGCVPCRCEDPVQCHGCGAHRCDEHARESRERQRAAEDAERRQRGQETTETTRLRARVAAFTEAAERVVDFTSRTDVYLNPEASEAVEALAALLAEPHP